MNKNILCLSWCDADNVVNYGQILQALAMMELLRKCTNGNVIYVSYFPRGLRDKIDYIFEHLNFKNGHLISYIKTKKSINRIVKKNRIDFHQIQSNKIPAEILDMIDIMLCGSDQIWHPQNYDKNYFLGFGDSEIKRVAFAASLPKTHIERQFEKQYKSMKSYLNKFDSIAVREPSSVPFISELSSKEVDTVMDPTFIVPIEFWNGIIENVEIADNYLFVYIPNLMDEQMANNISLIAKKMKIGKILVMITRGKNLVRDATVLNFVSLGEFLYLIKHARCVVTSSFHAVVFSAIFHTNFYAYNVTNDLRGEDVRLGDILETLGLKDREIDNGKPIIDSDIDFSLVEQKIREKSEISFRLLKKNIQ